MQPLCPASSLHIIPQGQPSPALPGPLPKEAAALALSAVLRHWSRLCVPGPWTQWLVKLPHHVPGPCLLPADLRHSLAPRSESVHLPGPTPDKMAGEGPPCVALELACF